MQKQKELVSFEINDNEMTEIQPEARVSKKDVKLIKFLLIGLISIVTLLILIVVASNVWAMNEKYKSNMNASIMIPITYIWLGSELPNKYANRLKWITYPYTLLTDKDWEKYKDKYQKYNLSVIERADVLRMEYLYDYGGLYADFDVLIDYQCLMNLIYPLEGFFLIPDSHWVYTNGFMYSSQSRNKDLQKLIENTIKELEKTDHKVRTGPWPYRTYDFLRAVPGVQKCINHQLDETWNKDSKLNTI